MNNRREKITLYEPSLSTGDVNPSGQTPHVVFAERYDRGGTARHNEEIEQVEWKTRFMINKHGYALIDQSWYIEDRYGRTYNVVAIGDHPMKSRSMYIFTERRVA